MEEQDYNIEEKQAAKQKAFKTELFEYAEVVIFCICGMFLVFTFLVRVITVDGESMLPTLQHNDKLLISSLFYEPDYGDIVVVTQPTGDNKPYIKRIIALEGDQVDIDFEAGEVFVNDQLQREPYVNEPTFSQYDVQFPLIVPEGRVFVMGDNRNHSKDSRDSQLGTVDTRYLLGRVMMRLLPFSAAGSVK